jgi:hypothetical protein
MGEIADYYRDQNEEYWTNPKNAKHSKAELPKLHKCKDGSIVDIRGLHTEYPKMTDSHLLNTIAFIKRKAENGITIMYGAGGSNAEDMWYDEEILYNKKALKHLGYKHYINEEKKRNLNY